MAEPPCAWHLASLPVPALARILLQLSLPDIAQLSQTCHQLQDALGQPALWQLACVLRWGNRTMVNTWHTPTYRDLYVQLCQYEDLPGLWHALGPDAPTCLFAFAWRPDCIQCWTLQPAQQPPAPLVATPLLRLDGGAPQGSMRLEILDGRIVLLQQVSTAGGGEGGVSPHADAVAAVAISGADAEAVLGSSPAGSFAHEMAQFIRGRVDGRRSRSRRRMARSPSGGMLDAIHHLERLIPSPRETSAPLSGLWNAVLPGYGSLLLHIHTDDTGAFEGSVVVAPPRGTWPRSMMMLLGKGTDLQMATPAKLVSFADHMNDVEHALQECTGDEHPLPLCLTMRACRQPLHAKAYLSIPETGGLDGLQQSMADVWLGGDALAVVDDTQGMACLRKGRCWLPRGWWRPGTCQLALLLMAKPMYPAQDIDDKMFRPLQE